MPLHAKSRSSKATRPSRFAASPARGEAQAPEVFLQVEPRRTRRLVRPAPSKRFPRRTLCIFAALQWTAVGIGSIILWATYTESIDSWWTGALPKKPYVFTSQRCTWTTSFVGQALHLDAFGNFNPSVQLLSSMSTFHSREGCQFACEYHPECAAISYINASASGATVTGTLCVLVKAWSAPAKHELWNSEVCNTAVVALNITEAFQCQGPPQVQTSGPYFTWRLASKEPSASREDLRCGPLFLSSLGNEAECDRNRTDPYSNPLSCCNRQAGWCISEVLCTCEDCVRYVVSAPMPLFQPSSQDSDYALPGRLPELAVSSTSVRKLECFVIVPGFGDLARLPSLQRSIAWLRKQEAEEDIGITCSVYVYDAFVFEKLKHNDSHPCRFVSMAGRWARFLQAVPEEAWSEKDIVLLWFDDVAVQPGANLRRMIEVMSCNGLSVLSPTYRPMDYDNKRWAIMYQRLPFRLTRELRESGVGRRVSFIEWQFTLMTPDSFRCLRGMVDVNISSHGWGLDTSFPFRCPGYCLGALDETTMYDTGAGSYSNDKAQSEMNEYYRAYGFPPSLMQTFGILKEPRKACSGRTRPSRAQWNKTDPLVPPQAEATMPPSNQVLLTSTELSLTFWDFVYAAIVSCVPILTWPIICAARIFGWFYNNI